MRGSEFSHRAITAAQARQFLRFWHNRAAVHVVMERVSLRIVSGAG